MERRESNPHNPERLFRQMDLVVQEPLEDKGLAIVYDCPDKDLCLIYNMAIKDVLVAEQLNPFLQGGEWNGPGWHMWELWKRTNRKRLVGGII